MIIKAASQHKKVEPESSAGTTEESGEHGFVALDAEAISILQAVFNLAPIGNYDASFNNQIVEEPTSEGFATTASVKFMITIQDEINLRTLGYSEVMISKFKPQEAADILHAGTKAVPQEKGG